MPTPNLLLLALCLLLASCENQKGIHIDFSKTPPRAILINDSNTRSVPVNFYISAQATDFEHYFALSSVHDDSAFLSRFSSGNSGILLDKQIDLSPYLRRFHDTLSLHYQLDKNTKFYEEEFSYLISSVDIRFFLSSGKEGIVLIAYQDTEARFLDFAAFDSTLLLMEFDRELNPLNILFLHVGDYESQTAHTNIATHQKLPDSSILISDFTYHNFQLVLNNNERLMYFDDGGGRCVSHKHDPITKHTHCYHHAEDPDFKGDMQIDSNGIVLGGSIDKEGYEPEIIFDNRLFLVKRDSRWNISNVLMVNLLNGESGKFSFDEHASVLNFLPADHGLWLLMDDPKGRSRLSFYRFD